MLGALADQGVVFFGGYASSLLSKYMPAKFRKMMEKQPDFDVLSLRPEETATIVKERLKYNEIRGVKVMKHDGLGERSYTISLRSQDRKRNGSVYIRTYSVS